MTGCAPPLEWLVADAALDWGDPSLLFPPVGGGAGGSHVSDWQACKVPLRRVTFGDASIVVHEGLVAAVQRIEAKWKARGGNAAYRIRPADTGAYNCRKTTSGTSWSKHSWAVAVDVNWQTNPYGRKLVTDMPRWFVDLWKAEGFGWGGDWNSVKDAMHFSKFPNEGGDGLLYQGAAPPPTPAPEEWDEMASKAEIQALIAAQGRTVGHGQVERSAFNYTYRVEPPPHRSWSWWSLTCRPRQHPVKGWAGFVTADGKLHDLLPFEFVGGREMHLWAVGPDHPGANEIAYFLVHREAGSLLGDDPIGVVQHFTEKPPV